MESPSSKEIEKFLIIFDKLCQFEASQRVVRGYGCFKEEELPFKEVVKVVSWLKSRIKKDEKDVIDGLINKYERVSEDLRVKSAQAKNENDYISSSVLNEEADIYDQIIDDLKDVEIKSTFKLK